MACGQSPHTRRPFLWDAGYPAPPATYPDGKIWTQIPKQASHRPYSVLLPVGFAVPPALPPARCALTAPFHPYRGKTLRTAAVCSLWHYPWVRTRRMLSGTACPRSPDFPPRQPFGFAGAAVQPTDAQRDGRSTLRRQGPGAKGPATWLISERRPARRRGRGRPWFSRARDWPGVPARCCASTDRRRRQSARDGSGAGMPSRLRG